MTEDLDRLKTALADRYTIERQLGAGGMATVYLAHDVKHDRKVAIKVLRSELAAVLGAERFLHEIKVTANLQHPHILQLFDSGEADSFLYYVMAYVGGESLREKLHREKQLPIDESIAITQAVASALDYAHRHNVIHRDIKPENILLHDGQALVADFGIALAVNAAGGTRLTETGISLGTPHYMSPEQASADRELDGRSDIYSLAATLYEMLVGRPPFDAASAQAIVAKIMTEEPGRVTVERGTVPGHVDATIHKALAKLPADRFATASQFVEALTDPSAVLWPPTGIVPGLGEPPALARAIIARRWLSLAIPLSLAVLAAVAGTALWGWLRPTAPPRALPMRFEVPLPSGAAYADVRGHAVALSPDGAYITYVDLGEGGQQLFLRPMGQLEATPVRGTEGATNPAFSPDGQSIVFVQGGSRLATVRVGGGPATSIQIETTDGAAPRGIRGSAWDAGDVIFVGSTTGLWRVPAEGGIAEQLTTLEEDRVEFHSRPEPLPGGRGVLFTVHTGAIEEAQVAVLSLATREVRVLFPGNTPRYSPTGHLLYGRADGVLMAVPFDPRRLEATGPAVSVVEGVLVKESATTEFAVARNGSLMYLSMAGASGEIVMVGRRGREQSLIQAPTLLRSPRFSPDGARLAYVSGIRGDATQVWVYEIEQGTSMPLTFEGDNHYPVWSPDGGRVVFSSDRGPASRAADLYWKPADGSGVAEPLLSADLPQRAPAYSGDGRFVVYREEHPVTGYDLWVLPLQGDQKPHSYGEPSVHNEMAAAISPDGRWLAYASDVSGRDEVYVNSFPEAGVRRPVSVDGGTEPIWSRDGRELFYRRGRALMVAAVETTPDFRVLSREVLFEGPYIPWEFFSNYDIHPDGERFVMVRPSGEASTRIVVVLNWFEELERAMGGR